VVFQWCTEGQQQNCDIYIKQIGAEPPQRLTTDPARDFSPVWSPDGQSIAFLRERSPNLTALILIPQRGGQERVLGESNVTQGDPTPQLWLDWTPDSKWLVLPWRGKGQGANGLSLFNVETRETRPLTTHYDYGPAFSPDGRSLLFVRDPLGLFLLRVRQDYQPQEEPQQIVAGQEYVEAAWTSDGKEIVFSCFTLGRGLWRMKPFSSTPPRKLPVGDEDVYVPAVSRQGNRLAYDVVREDYNIWRVDLEGPGRNPGTPTQFIASTRQDSEPTYSPDGKRIAFTSDRSGSFELWLCDADGSNAVQLTSFKGAYVIHPRWSPDGQSIAMWKMPGYEVYTISADGGVPRLLTEGRFPSWSWDGQWLYFRMGEGLWKMPSMGGKATQIQKIDGVDIPQESPNGKTIYYSKGWHPNCSIWKIPAAGGEEVKVLDATYGFWTMGRQGIYYFSPPDGKGRRELRVYNLAAGESKRILSVERLAWSPTASPDGKTILYSQQDQAGSDLMLVENFR
jgi:Tol biopolymer transport system component